MLQAMMTVQKDRYGLGWALSRFNGRATIWHTGKNEGFYCYTWLCPESGQGLVIFTNSDNGSDFVDEVMGPLRTGDLR